jgi:hypothetical protein
MGMKLAAFLIAATAAAQTPSIIHVMADESQVLVGRTLQMRAVVRDASGNPIPNATVTWTTNQSSAPISPAGVVSPRGLATIRVTARAGGVAGEAAIQAIPSRIEVTPGTAQIEVGAQQRFQAAAFDADGSVIPAVTFAWSLTNQRQGTSSLGRIDAGGNVTATGEGGAFVFATYNYNETFPGLQQRWVAYAPIAFTVPRSYELRRLYGTLHQTRQSWPLRPRQSMLWTTDNGDLFLNASLGGLANALLNWDNGKWRVVSGGGVPRFGRASMALEFRTHSITRDGKVLTYEDTNINGAELNLGTRDGVEPFLSNNVPLGNTEAVSGINITRNSHTSAGWTLVRANFRFPAETVTFTGIFRGLGNASEMLVSTKDTVPEMPGAFTVDADFGIAGDGTAFYSLTSGSTRVFYRHGYEGRKKLIGVGDEVLGSKVRSFSGGRTNSPSVWFDEDGTAYVCVVLEDGSTQYLQFAPDGKLTALRVNTHAGILSRHPRQGALIYANPYNNKGNGIYLWQGDQLTPVYTFGRRLFDQAIQEVESGAVDAEGAVTLFFRCDGNAMMVARMGDTPFFLFRDGDEVQVDLPVNLFTLVPGARTGPPHAQMGGNGGSIAEFAGGEWNLVVGIGQRLFGNAAPWFGGGTGSMRKEPGGDVYFTAGTTLARVRPGGAPEAAIAFPLRLEGTVTANIPGTVWDANNAGGIAMFSSTSAGDSRIVYWQNGQARSLLNASATAATASTIDGKVVQNVQALAVDDNGRVIAQVQFRNTTPTSLLVWDGSAWTVAATVNTTRISNRNVTGLPTMPRANGQRLFAAMTVSTGGNVVAEWTGGAWQVVVDVDTVMPNGQNSNNVPAVEVNGQGDLLFQYANGVNSMVVRRGGRFRQVHSFFQPTADGDWLIRINSMDFRDDGTVYFLAVTAEDEVVLYEARPVN